MKTEQEIKKEIDRVEEEISALKQFYLTEIKAKTDDKTFNTAFNRYCELNQYKNALLWVVT